VSTDWRDLPPVDEADRPEIREGFIPSQTFLRTMDRCDRAAMLYLLYRAGAGGHQLNRGSVVHETIDRLVRIMAEQEEAKMAPEIGRDVLYEVMADNPALQVSGEERDAARYMIAHWCKGVRIEPGTVLGIERTITLETGGFKVLIRPDLILDLGDGLCGIDDWKTAWPPDSEEFRRQAYDAYGRPRWAGNYQLNMAAVIAAFGTDEDGLSIGNFDRFRLRLGFPRKLYQVRPEEFEIDFRTVEVDRLQLQNFRDDLDLQLHRLREVCIGEGRWQPTPGSQCRECPAEYACPLPVILRPESQHAQLDSIEDLEKAATSVQILKAQAANLTARVKKAALRLEKDDPTVLDLRDGQRGVMCGSDIAMTFTPYEQEKIDTARLIADAEAGVNYGEKFNPEESKKIVRGEKFEKRKVAP
jgi:hypothetical protein